MAADQARCVFCTVSAMRKIGLLVTRRSPSSWRKFSSSVPWSVDTSQRNPCGPALLTGNGSSSSSTSTTPDYTSLLGLTPTYTVSHTRAPPPAKPRHGNDGWAIPPLHAPTETFMAIPPLPKGRRRRPKRNEPLPFSQIPRTLTHHPQEKSPYGVGNRYRGVFLNHLAPGTTHADVTAGIAATAPVGPITSVTLLRPLGAGADDADAECALGQLRAHVVFGRYQATAKLVEAAREGVLRIKGAVVAQVTTDRRVAYHWNSARRIDSRVLLVRGRPETPGFTEAALRAAMEADAESMAAAGPLGARSEPVVCYEVDGGCVTMEWRFFSHMQAMAMRTAVERAYGEQLEVYKGWDPCWVDEEKGQLPEKLNREQAWRNAWG